MEMGFPHLEPLNYTKHVHPISTGQTHLLFLINSQNGINHKNPGQTKHILTSYSARW